MEKHAVQKPIPSQSSSQTDEIDGVVFGSIHTLVMESVWMFCICRSYLANSMADLIFLLPPDTASSTRH